jgi:pimeloyl-ACP methyl ester carboxylesterase
MPSRFRLAFVVVAFLSTMVASDALASPAFNSCRAGLGIEVECTQVPVQLDRTGAVAGSISVHVERIQSRSRPSRGVLFVLSGGPGESVSAGTATYADALAPALATRDLILIDQRGTGLSGALSCPESFNRAETRVDASREIAACGAALGTRLPFFTVADVVDDLEDVRRALGIERIALMGVSYGTRIALAYASRYPQHVERLVLDSVVPLSDSNSFRLNSFAAMPRVLKELCGRSCPFTADPSTELAELVRRLAAGPLVGRVARGDGRLHTARIGRTDLMSLLLAADFLPLLRAPFPAAVHSALGGDVAPLLRLKDVGSMGFDPDVRSFSMALFLATTCAESAEPWIGLATPEERTAAARGYVDQASPELFAPFDRETAIAVSDLVICRSWPSGTGRAALFEAPLPDVPTLIFAGTADLRTPLEDAVAVAALFPRAQLVPVRGVGHGVMFQGLKCVDAAFGRFLAGQTAARCAGVKTAAAARPVADPRRKVPPLTSVLVTLDDVLAQLPVTIYTKATFRSKDFLFFLRAGGLRGGRYSATDRSLKLEGVTVMPGVSVSGTITGDLDPFAGAILRASGRLTVRLGAGRGGVLELDRGRLTGTLDGRRVARRLVLDGRSLAP